MDAASRHYPRTRREARATRVAFIAAVIALGACAAGCETAECVPGDLQGCRCADQSYGYRTCSVGGRYFPDAACDCIRGLTPDASRD